MDGGWQPELYEIPLLGFHQLENATTAYAALSVCNRHGLSIPDQAIYEGYKSVNWPARFEILTNAHLLIVDSAHNRDSATRLRIALDDYLPDKTIDMIFGASEDKDIEGFLAEILPRIDHVYATKSEHPRAMEPELIVNLVHRMGKPVTAFNKVEDALDAALKNARKGYGHYCDWQHFHCCSSSDDLVENEQGIYEMKNDDWMPRTEDEDFASSLHQRTDELYRIPNAQPDEAGLIECPVLALRDLVVFPRMISPIFIPPGPSLLAIQEAQYNDMTVIGLSQKNSEIEVPDPEDLLPIGVEIAVGRLLNMPDGNNSALMQGRRRVEVVEVVQRDPYIVVSARPIIEPVDLNPTHRSAYAGDPQPV